MKKILLSGIAMLTSVSAYATPLFEIPSADVVQLKADFVSAGAVILGLAVLFMSYRFIKRLIK